jgi:hypothetical protein
MAIKAPYYGKSRAYQKYEANDAFAMAKVYLPKATLEILRDAGRRLGMPISRLCALAVDNELDAHVPFNYPCPMPETPYKDYEYADEAGKLLAFLKKFPSGTTVETVMLCRRDIGVESRQSVMHAYRELLAKNLIEEFTGASRRYSHEHVRVRAVGLDPAKLNRAKYKRVEGESNRGERAIRDEDVT